MYGISIPTDMLHFSARKFFREPSSFLTDRLEHRLTAILLVYDEMYLNCYVQFCNSPTVISAPNACRLELILKINLRNIKSFNILWTVCCKRSGQFNQISFLTLRRLMSYIYGAPIFDVSRSHTTTQHSR